MTPSCPTSRLVAALAFTAALTGAVVAAGVAVTWVAVKRQMEQHRRPLEPVPHP